MVDNALVMAKKMADDRAAGQAAERLTALKLAQGIGAVKTVSAIKDPNQCYEDILKTAALELGLEKLVSYLLKEDPFWASNALQYVPNLGSYRDALIKKAAESPEAALHTLNLVDNIGSHANLLTASAGILAQTQRISGFEVYNDGSFNCEFTMYWQTSGGSTQPSKDDTKVWSDKMMVYQSAKNSCADFRTEKSVLEPGDQVWLYLWVQAGRDMESPLRFTYDPTTLNYAHFIVSGTTQKDSLGLTEIAPPTA